MKYDVPLLTQSINPICWVVCAAMVQKYWQHTAGNYFDTTHLTGGANPTDSCIANTATYQNQISGLRAAGFQTVPSQLQGPMKAFTARNVKTLLSNHGPLWFSHLTANFNYGGRGTPSSRTGGHVVVITGIEGNRAYFNNPWGYKDVMIPTGDLIASLNQSFSAGRYALAYANQSIAPGNVIY